MYTQPTQTNSAAYPVSFRPSWYAGLQRQSKVGCLECIER